MANQFLFYISAAGDLAAERAALGQIAATLPVTLGWQIVQTPLQDGPLEQAAIAHADLHLLLLGQDIRAPIGLEWLLARRAGRLPIALRKRLLSRTIAACDFVRSVEQVSAWHQFGNSAELTTFTQKLLADTILRQATYFSLTNAEYETLQQWRNALDASAATAAVDQSTNSSGVILSAERFEPSSGILLDATST